MSTSEQNNTLQVLENTKNIDNIMYKKSDIFHSVLSN